MRAVALRVFRVRRRLARLFLVLRAGTAGVGLHRRAGAGAGVGAAAGWRRALRALEMRAVCGVCLGIHAVTSRAPLSSVPPVSQVRA
ncbi:hypothetical protein C8J57DRAFT_1277962 [Mycena rebaudengoi]|nr:hypothetical protein C8J57DRAFT_1277962 [Mycena rebaudengoi]